MLNAARFLLVCFALLLAGVPEAFACAPQNRVWKNFAPVPGPALENVSQVAELHLENPSLYDWNASGSTVWTKFDPEGLAGELAPEPAFNISLDISIKMSLAPAGVVALGTTVAGATGTVVAGATIKVALSRLDRIANPGTYEGARGNVGVVGDKPTPPGQNSASSTSQQNQAATEGKTSVPTQEGGETKPQEQPVESQAATAPQAPEPPDDKNSGSSKKTRNMAMQDAS